MKSSLGLAVLFSSLGFSLPLAAQQTLDNSHAADAIGTVNFQAACDKAVRADVDHALGMIHHMMYTQARGEFEAVVRADPGCAMAHWGIATALFQPLWGTTPSADDIARGREAIRKARDTVTAPRERRLIEATGAFFDPETDRVQERLAGWIRGMEAAYQGFPEDPDVASLYALSRLTLAVSADDREALHDEAEQVLRRVWDADPSHPGAVHYSIHSTDADGRAGNATGIVASYGAIAPSVPHALHMPSHIFVRVGDWPGVIEWNRRSADIAVSHVMDGAKSFHYIHALDYLVYGHLQRGEDSAARDVGARARTTGPHQANFPGVFHQASIPARLAVETRDWEAAAALVPRDSRTIDWAKFPWPDGLTWFARGLGAVHTGDMKVAREAEQQLSVLAENAAAGADQRFSTYIEVDRRILAGWIAKAEGNPELAVSLMRSAGELEASVEKHPVSPGALLPPYEALGDLLLALDRPAEALAAYENSDGTWPQRYNTLSGAAHAATLSGDKESVALWSRRLLEVAPDSERVARQPNAALPGGVSG
ncbi:hypothetical protein [Marinobacter sp.]|uniref:hypothetical protein n=1 Tax=Marinobacter sp. TaxID=50741 RepID=UPI00384ED038